jgi:hypothetical protein
MKNTLYIYQASSGGWVICLSEFRGKPKNEMKLHLGEYVPGEAFAVYAQRHLQGMDYQSFKGLMQVAYPHIKFEWWKS